ncbi:MAG: carbohydrate kinase [Clostridiales bacterium]|nr:carbohydrate kinase [Clostridiales bacterium]
MAGDVLVTIGEALIDFIPSEKGCDFDKVGSFIPAIGGAPANVCAAYAKLGGKARMLTKLGNDPFGSKIVKELGDIGIDTSHIIRTDDANTALAFVSLSEDGNRTFAFYRNPSADMLYRYDEMDSGAFEDVFALHFCSVSLGDFPMKDAHYRAIEEAREQGALISFDPNLRFMLWNDRDKLWNVVNEFLPNADILKISDDELEFILGTDNIDEVLPVLWEEGIKLVLYTLGAEGMKAYTPGCTVAVKSEATDVVDTTGAGDMSIGALLKKLCEMGINRENIGSITEDQLRSCLEFSSKCCAYSVSIKGAIPSFPAASDLK